jgi:hypothetical protein
MERAAVRARIDHRGLTEIMPFVQTDAGRRDGAEPIDPRAFAGEG